MALMTAYLLKTSNLGEFFNAIQSARAPERFTQQFLKDLDFRSSNDRLLVGVLKGLGFIDDSGVPQQRYFEFLDQSNSGRVLAEAIEEAYSDLFNLRKDAQNMEIAQVKGKFKSLTQGQKSDNVINNMAATFSALCEQADWSKPSKAKEAKKESVSKENEAANQAPHKSPDSSQLKEELADAEKKLELHYNIQLILPNSRDQAVFDALFTSLKKHLL
ncbi:DUF5343 domain-containing protein [Bowmanella dokdonensis]|uniref:DUF5343 domain-containing protein n=1 Tax=Bowmanella dokdonensis TaxID=751969 RepID=A0A939DKI1_9ALTE|nr:DUF5343 domain-containing protein [Bowmanella dokdonensis]MBN7824214.1 DUF5343 domain-containing protein [Bowmanella dokdonensis]